MVRCIAALVVGALYSTSAPAEDALLSSGIKLAQQEHYAEAVEVFRQCVMQSPRSFEAHYDLALALFALGRLPESREAIEQIKPLSLDEMAARNYILGKIDMASGDKVHARAELSAAFKARPDDENGAIDYGLFLLHQSDYATAIATFSRAKEAHPQSLYVLLGEAIAQAFGGAREDAVLECRHIIEINPHFAPALLVMAFAQYISGAYPGAEQTAAAGLRMPSPAPYLYYLHAAALQKMHSTEYAAMLSDLDVAERNLPSCALCYLVRSEIHESAGDIPAAITDLNTLLTRFAPDFDQAWYRLGGLYRKEGQNSEAQLAFARVKASLAASNPELDFARDSLLKQGEK